MSNSDLIFGDIMDEKQICKHRWMPVGYIRRDGVRGKNIQQFQCEVCGKNRHSEFD